MRLVLIRHGKTYGNLMRRYIGTTDEDILENTVITKEYPDADIVIASPLKRCVQTARLIYPKKDIELCRDFSETDFGDFENKSYEDLKSNEQYLEWLASNGKLPFPNGEPHEHFKSRCIAAHKKIISEYEGKNLAYVVHGGTIMAVMQHIFGGEFYDYQAENL
ncbi:MAG: histidine phosphatase family protein, partial [Candidatus Ornithomonoglobus sp.]